MEITSYRPSAKNLTRLNKPETHYKATLLVGVALVGIAMCAHHFTGGNWTRLLGLAGGVIAADGFIRFATRSGIDLALYPGKFKDPTEQVGYKTWNSPTPGITAVRIQTDVDTVIDARLLKPTNGNGKILVHCGGNNELYERWKPEDFQWALDQGYAVCLYNPPSYGHSTGTRTPEGDFRAIEGVIDYLTKKEGYEVGQIEVEAYSLGSGSACHAASKFGLAGLVLYAPIGKMEDVVERLISNIVSWPIGRRIAAWITTPVVRAHFDYDNVAKLQDSHMDTTSQVEIYDRRDDVMMTKGGISEGSKLQKSVKGYVTLETVSGRHGDGAFNNIPA